MVKPSKQKKTWLKVNVNRSLDYNYIEFQAVPQMLFLTICSHGQFTQCCEPIYLTEIKRI